MKHPWKHLFTVEIEQLALVQAEKASELAAKAQRKEARAVRRASIAAGEDEETPTAESTPNRRASAAAIDSVPKRRSSTVEKEHRKIAVGDGSTPKRRTSTVEKERRKSNTPKARRNSAISVSQV